MCVRYLLRRTLGVGDGLWQAGRGKSCALVRARVGRAGGLCQPTRSLDKGLGSRHPELGAQAPRRRGSYAAQLRPGVVNWARTRQSAYSSPATLRMYSSLSSIPSACMRIVPKARL